MSTPNVIESKEIETNSKVSVTRVDRGLINNVNDLQKAYGNDAELVFDILIYLSHRIDNNLFDNISFVIRDFASFTGYEVSNLHRLHPDIKSGLVKLDQVTDNKTGRVFSSVIDYVLYQMMTKAIMMSSVKYYDEGMQDLYMGLLPIVNLSITNYSKAKVTTALHYEITINPYIKKNLFKNFNYIESKGFFNVGKGSGGGERKRMYLILCWQASLIANEKNYKDTFNWSVDEWIKRISPANSLRNDPLRSIDKRDPNKKKEALKRKFKIILDKGKIPFTYEFINYRTHGEEYQVQIIFKKTELTGFINTKEGKFRSHVFNSLSETYAKNNSVDLKHPTHMMAFENWLVSNKDVPTKTSAVINAYKQYFFKELNHADALIIYSKGIDFLSL